jgi:peptidoglycan/xylan/chitin deacetylase (PgdA/CDA1 family)
MSIFDIHEWLYNGMSIGSHSFDHLDLTILNKKDIKFQLSKSKFLLEDLLSKKIKSFCYPYGKYNKDIILEVKKEYKNAVSTNRSRYNPRIHSEFLIPRIDMGKKTFFN